MQTNKRNYLAILIAVFVFLHWATAFGQQPTENLTAENVFDISVREVDGMQPSLEIRWYPSKGPQNFIVLCRDVTNGETTEKLVSERTFVSIEGIDPAKEYEISVIAIDEANNKIAQSPVEKWQSPSRRTAIAMQLAAQSMPSIQVATLDAILRTLDSNNFPFIFTTVAVDTGNNSVGSLTGANFTAYEDGRLQTDYFEVTPPQQGGGVRILDFVFLIDNSGSMGPEQQDVKNNVKAFVDSLIARQIDVRLGLVRFGQSANGGQPILVNNSTMTSDVNLFKSWLDQMTVDGGYEPGLLAVYQAATSFSLRPGSQRHFLLITDEDSDEGNLSQSIAVCQDNNIVVNAAIDCAWGTSQTDYCGPNSIRGATNGLLFSVIGPYSDILNSLQTRIGDTYIVRYRTDNPVLDGVQREVRIVVNAFNQSDFVIGYYTPGAAPQIHRTQATINLSNTAQIAGVALTIEAEITDAAAPFVQSATLFYRTTGTVGYVATALVAVGNNIYRATIPGVVVNSPGLDYYLTATDGQTTSSDPAVDPDVAPYQIAILPNQPPVITHTPVTSGTQGDPIPITATVTDNTNFLTSVSMRYREFGTLLFNAITMTSIGGNQYQATIPGSAVTANDVEYYIRAVDNFGLASVHGVHHISVGTPPPIDCSTTFTDDFSAGEGNWAPNTPSQWSITYFGGDPAFCVSVPDPVGDEYALQKGNPWLDFDLEMDARASASSNKNFFILFGVTDYNNATSNGYYLQFALGGVKLYRSINGSDIPIASSAGDFVNDNAFHHIRVERHAPNIKAYADGILLIDVNDDMFVIGSIGFGSYMSTACFDDVHISGTQSNQGHFADYFDDYNANGWTPLNPGRWQVVDEGISPRYFLNTTNYDSPDGMRLGEYSLISGQSWGDFTFACVAKSLDAAQALENADLCVVFGYQDANNYYYAIYNRAEGLSGIQRIQGGTRTMLASYALRTFDDGSYHQLRVERASSQIEVFFDGTLIASAFDNTFGDGQIGVGSFNDAGYFDNVTISGGCIAPPPPPTVLATATIPSGQTVAAGNTLAVPIRVTTAKNIGVAQLTIEYDGNDLLYNSATVGSEAPGFSISQQNPNPSFGPTTPGTNRNLIVQISGGGTNTFTGNDRTVVILHFTAIGVLGANTPLAFDHDCSHTFLSTPSFEDICGSQITFNNGDASITVAPQISGTVRYYSAARPVSSASVALAGAVIASQTTDANGAYNFTGLSTGNYTITPSKSGDIRGAITGSDAIKVLQAVAFVISLTPDEALAADVDENSAVTGADAVAILRYLAFLPSGTANTGKWKFSPANYSIALTTNEIRDFSAFLLGEVTGNWGSTAPLAAASSPVDLEIGVLKWSNGSLRIPLRVPNDAATIYTMMSTLRYSFTTAGVFHFEPAVAEAYFAINNASEGKMHMALARLNGFAPGSLIGELVCDLPENNSAELDEKEVIGEFVDLSLNDVPIANVLVQNIATSTAIPEEYTLLQNYPNPFNAGTTIRFAVPKTGEKTEISLEIYSLNGQKIRTLYRGQPTAGYHTQVWDGRDDRDRVVGSGVYLYRLTAGEFIAKRKLLLLK